MKKTTEAGTVVVLPTRAAHETGGIALVRHARLGT